MKWFPVASVMFAAAALAFAPSATGQTTGADSVTGTSDSGCVEPFEVAPGFIICLRRLNVDIDVESGPAGEQPTGTLNLRSTGSTPGGSFEATADATCLSVSGHVAIIGLSGNLHQGGAGGDFGMAGLVRVVDGGGSSSGADSVEFAYRTGDELFGPPLPGPTTCASFPGPFFTNSFAFPTFTNAVGDLVVTDAAPLPTTKEQCRRGGWKTFGVFKNQGDCVSFVATKGNSPG
jgi:hypothetical protein